MYYESPLFSAVIIDEVAVNDYKGNPTGAVTYYVTGGSNSENHSECMRMMAEQRAAGRRVVQVKRNGKFVWLTSSWRSVRREFVAYPA